MPNRGKFTGLQLFQIFTILLVMYNRINFFEGIVSSNIRLRWE